MFLIIIVICRFIKLLINMFDPKLRRGHYACSLETNNWNICFLEKKDLINRGFVKKWNNFLKTTLLKLSRAKLYRNYMENGLKQGWVPA